MQITGLSEGMDETFTYNVITLKVVFPPVIGRCLLFLHLIHHLVALKSETKADLTKQQTWRWKPKTSSGSIAYQFPWSSSSRASLKTRLALAFEIFSIGI